MNLYVVELNHTEIATDDDKQYGIDKWAKLFKATTWEEIKMITKENPSLNSTAESIFLSNADFAILEQCRAREDAIAHENYQNEKISNLSKKVASLNEENASLNAERVLLSDKVDDITKKYDDVSKENIRLKKLLEENGINP